MSNINEVTKRAADKLLAKKGVHTVGIGQEIKGGKRTGRIAIICSVEKKIPLETLAIEDVIPYDIEGQPTDVIEAGQMKALHTSKHRPAPSGVSIGHYNITAGTLGCLVSKGGKTYILSNNHVLADENYGITGDEIIQPGAYDGGATADTIASLADYIPIEFEEGDIPPPPPAPDGGSSCKLAKVFTAVTNKVLSIFGRKTRVQAIEPQVQGDGINYVDAALALPVLDSVVSPTIYNSPYGDRVAGLSEQVFVTEKIYKSGRTTGITTDEVLQVSVVSDVMYGNGRVARFYDQILAGPMSAGGDSGSLVLDLSNNAVGLLFAGSDTTTLINPISYVLNELNIDYII